jgi:hypothetical protein
METKNEAPAWATQPLLTADTCDNLTWQNASEFYTRYNEPEDRKDSMEKARDKAKGAYLLASAVINRSRLCTAESLGLKETMKTLRTERDILLSGTSLSGEQMEQHRAYSAQADQEIQNSLKQSKKLEPAQKKTMTLSISMYLLGSYMTYDLKKRVEKYTTEVENKKDHASQYKKDGNYAGAAIEGYTALKGGLDLTSLGTFLPGHVQKVVVTGAELRKFAKNNKLEVPADATRFYHETNGEAW